MDRRVDCRDTSGDAECAMHDMVANVQRAFAIKLLWVHCNVGLHLICVRHVGPHRTSTSSATDAVMR